MTVGTMTGALVYAYFYLRLDAQAWPLNGADPASLGLPLLAASLVVVALVLALAPAGWARGRDLAVVPALGGVILQMVALSDSGVSIGADSYQALVVTLEVWAACWLVVAILFRVASVVALRRPGHHAALAESEVAAWFGTLGIWLAVWVVVHLGPRLV